MAVYGRVLARVHERWRLEDKCHVGLQYGLDPILISVLTHWQSPSLVLPTERTVDWTAPGEASCPSGWKRGS